MLGCFIFFLCFLSFICHSLSYSLIDSAASCFSYEATNEIFHKESKCEKMVGPRVTINQGVLEGRIKVTQSGFEYNSFQGIPYANPPIGELRFRDPQPARKWEGILDAAEVGNACSQMNPIFVDKYKAQEDCLFLNVYVPRTDRDHRPFPVMVWIHGGAFFEGDGSPEYYGPDYLIERNVIVVTLNYRLGVFGFLSLNTPDVPGNAGLKDQSLALKWVHKNIQNFNGDENEVTLFGESAGAASVHYHTLSSMSRGLFQRVIIQSGTANCLWALQKDPESVAFRLAEELGYTTDSKDEVASFLRGIPYKNLTLASFSPSFVGKIRLTFSPTTEKTFPNTEAFITRTPQELLKTGDFQKIPMLGGMVSAEGIAYRASFFRVLADNDAVNNNYIPDLKRFVPDELIEKYGENGVDEIMTKIQKFYFPKSGNISEGLTRLYSDYLFVKDIFATFTEQFSTFYYYQFTYSGSRNYLKILSGLNYTGAGHADELGYIFDMSNEEFIKIPLTESDVLITERMVSLWTNFAKYGNPTPETTEVLPNIWKPAKQSNVICLHIDLELKITGNPFEEIVAFWKSIYEM